MKYTELSQHLHLLRHEQSGRAVGASMRVGEVYNAILQSNKSSVEAMRFYFTHLPRPYDGFFARMLNEETQQEIGLIFVHEELDRHWREFVAIKEMMHCFTPGSKYVSGPKEAAELSDALSSKMPRYTPAVAADDGAILAAAEVMLPHYTVERQIAAGADLDQIAAHHGLHPDVVHQICRVDMLYHRKNGDL